jgi:hypothetical protein
MAQRLLVSTLHEWQLVMVFIQGLSKPCDVSVSKDSKGCGNKSLSSKIRNRILICDIQHHSLSHG